MVFSACSTGSSTMKSDTDSLSYAVGIDLGKYLDNMNDQLDGELNVSKVFAAINDVLKDKAAMEQEDAYAFLREYFTVRVPEKNKKASEEFLADVEKSDPEIKKTESGLLYKVIEAGDISVMAANDADQVSVTYEGTLKNGSVFDSSFERGDTATFALNRVIPGWSEGMKLVGKGGKIKLWIPSELGYGAQGAGQKIGANQALVFEVNLIDVIPAAVEETPAEGETPAE